MTFEFLVACRVGDQIDVRKTLSEALSNVLESNLNQFEQDQVEQMIQIRCWRDGEEVEGENGEKLRFVLVGLAFWCAPKARVTSGGGFRPESCRLIW